MLLSILDVFLTKNQNNRGRLWIEATGSGTGEKIVFDVQTEAHVSRSNQQPTYRTFLVHCQIPRSMLQKDLNLQFEQKAITVLWQGFLISANDLLSHLGHTKG